MQYNTISLYDLDHTLLKVNGSFQFGLYLYKKGLIPIRQMLVLFGQYAIHKWGFISPERLNNSACKTFFSGKLIVDIEEHINAFLNEYLEDLLYYPIANNLVNAHQQGHYTVILSSSPHFLVKPIAERLGVNAWGSTQYAVDAAGVISHVESHMDGHSKALYVSSLCKELNVPIKDTIAYSDSYYDLSFLKIAGTAKVVMPDRKLRKHCLENNWEIL